ncbi:hypothetical protein ID866_8210 [Astraeus odoratus]|nr:hypothetical protein ID866_8210 [Astraeus odoratus]
MDVLVQTVRKEGFLALYKGMASPLIGIAGVNSLLFASYATSKRIVSPFPQLTLPQTALAGAMAGAANAILASPVEMFKVIMQGQYGTSKRRLRNIVMETWLNWGFRRGIMRGYWITVAREIPAYAGPTARHLHLAFEFSKRQFQSRYGQQLPVWALLASGATGGVGSLVFYIPCPDGQSCTYIICTRSHTGSLVTRSSRVQLRPTPPTSRPWVYINAELQSIVAESGVSGLFRGLSPSCKIYSKCSTLY